MSLSLQGRFDRSNLSSGVLAMAVAVEGLQSLLNSLLNRKEVIVFRFNFGVCFGFKFKF
jgi:hypothetical protein